MHHVHALAVEHEDVVVVAKAQATQGGFRARHRVCLGDSSVRRELRVERHYLLGDRHDVAHFDFAILDQVLAQLHQSHRRDGDDAEDKNADGDQELGGNAQIAEHAVLSQLNTRHDRELEARRSAQSYRLTTKDEIRITHERARLEFLVSKEWASVDTPQEDTPQEEGYGVKPPRMVAAGEARQGACLEPGN